MKDIKLNYSIFSPSTVSPDSLAEKEMPALSASAASALSMASRLVQTTFLPRA